MKFVKTFLNYNYTQDDYTCQLISCYEKCCEICIVIEPDRKRQAAEERSDRRHLLPILINSIDIGYRILANEVGVEDGIGRQLAKPIVACEAGVVNQSTFVD